MKKKVLLTVGAIVLALIFYLVAQHFFIDDKTTQEKNKDDEVINEPLQNQTVEDQKFIVKDGKRVTVEDIDQFTCSEGYTMKEGMCVKYNYIDAIKHINCTKGVYNGKYCITYSEKESNNFTVEYNCDEGFTKVSDNICRRIYAVDNEKNCTKNGGNLVAGNCIIELPATKSVTCKDKDYSYNPVKDQCLLITKTNPVITYTCKEGYTLDKDKCYILDKVEPTKNY